MYLNESVLSHVGRCEAVMNGLHDRMSGLPDGVLRLHRCRNDYLWRVTDADGTRHNLPKTEEKEAELLALRKLYAAQLHDIGAEAEACRRYLRCKERSVSAVEALLSKEPPEFRRLLKKHLSSRDQRVRAWEEAPYEKSRRYPQELKYPTLKENEYVRSKLEAMYAAGLTSLKIPYRYEQILRIGGIEIAADFITLDVRTFQEIPVELFGMMDDPEYRKNYERKMKTYIDGGYIPGVNMLTFYESSKSPLSQAIMLEELEYFFFKRAPILL